MEVTALLAGGPRNARKYSSLAEAQEDYRWYEQNGPREVEPVGDVVGWAWETRSGPTTCADVDTADWVLRRGPRGGLRWERQTGAG